MNKAVLNPKTGRKVSVNSSLGKKILNDYSQNGGNPILFEIMRPRMLNRSPNDMNPVRHSPDVIIDQKISSTCSRCHNLSMLKEQIDTQLKSSCSDCKKLIEKPFIMLIRFNHIFIIDKYKCIIIDDKNVG